jgi:hypothetical protein
VDSEEDHKPLIVGRGLVLLADFVQSVGLDQAKVEALIRTKEIQGLVGEDGRVVGLFEDALPTAEQLRRLGLPVSPGYNPDHLRGTEGEDDDEHDDLDTTVGTWSLSEADRAD